MFYYLLFIERTKSIIYSFRDVSLSRNGPVRDAGHFSPFRDCPGQSGTAGHPSIGVHRPSLHFPYTVFSIRSYLPLDFNRVSSLRPTYRHPFGQPFTYSLLGEFLGLGLALVLDVVVPEAEQRCAWSRELDPNFCPGRGRTSDLGIYRAPLLLVASYDMQEATAGQF